jgi:hypothetical protein
MNSHQNTEIKNIQKVCICSHDRLNENDDTSNFTVELGQQVKDITEFKLVSGMVPLSSYTFNQDDDDRTFSVTNVSNSIRIRNTGTEPIYFNFAYYTRSLSPYGLGTFGPTELIRPRKDGLYVQSIQAGTPGSVALRLFNSVSEANNVSFISLHNFNFTVKYETLATALETFCSQQTSLDGFILSGLRFRDNWVSPFSENADAKNEFASQTMFSHPYQEDPGRDVMYFYNKTPNQTFNINVGWFGWNSSTSKYDIPISGASVTVNMNNICTRNPSGTNIYGIVPPVNFCNYKTELMGFPSSVMTNQSLIDYLNSQMQTQYGITFSKTQVGDVAGVDQLAISNTGLQFGFRKIENVFSIPFPFKRLGYRIKSLNPTVLWGDGDSIGPWENNLTSIQPLEPMNIYYEVKTLQINVLPYGVVLPDGSTSTGNYKLSDLMKQPNFDQTLRPYPLDYPAIKVNLDVVVDPNAINPSYYSLKMSSPDRNCRRLELSIDNKSRQFYVPTFDYYYKLSGPLNPFPFNNSTVADGLLFQPYYNPPTTPDNVWWNNPLPVTRTVTYSADTVYTESQLLTETQAITAQIPNLIFSVIEHKLKIQNTSESTAYLISANERLGIPVDVTLQPSSTYTAIELIDVSSLNDVIYISLPDLYQDGKNSYNSFKSLTSDQTHQRPIISSIVASLVNNSDVQYGKYVSYNNQADSWMRSTRKDLKTMKIQILDSEYRIIDLNKKAVHLEIDFR